MKITNKSGGPRGFFGADKFSPIIIPPGASADVEGFDAKLASHAAQIEAGEIEVGESKPAEKPEARAQPARAKE